MTALQMRTLMDLERAGWDALSASRGAEFYGEHMADDGVMILVNGTILDRAAAQASLNGAPAWDSYTLTEEQMIPAGPGAATLVYRAEARRGSEPAFEAIMSSTYALIDGVLRLTVYQQTTATH